MLIPFTRQDISLPSPAIQLSVPDASRWLGTPGINVYTNNMP